MKLWRRVCLLVLCAALLACGAAAAFPDVARGSWYEAAVSEMQADGLLTGFSDGSFRPGETVSAAQFVTIAARCAGLSPVSGQSAHWAAGTMEAALRAGWYDWDELPPTGERFDRPIPRKLAVKILMKALLPDVRGDYSTESAKIRDFSRLDGRYYEPVLAAYAAGVVVGDAQGNFRPDSGLSRAEASVLLLRARKLAGNTAQPPAAQPAVPAPAVTVKGGVSENGWLQVKGTQLCSAAGQPVALHGMSSHGIHWFGKFAASQAIANTAAYGANLFRVAMYTGEGGYLSNPAAVKAQAFATVDAAIANDMYVILDWHILSDGNPRDHQAEAVAFFTEAAARYHDSPAVLYEICNEPNGSADWTRDIKPYAEAVTAAIRAQSPRSIVLVGSSTWSQDLHLAAQSPLAAENVMYTLHFYAGTHGQALRGRIDAAMEAGLAVFVSEWGTSRADGSGGVFLEEARGWLDFLDARGISWANWSLCDKQETSAALRPGAPADRPWTQADLSESGQFVFSRF
ncbi:MAG: cellulase family glycosylhydrolase [Oscillospiraceae bacterium]|nr:cellulase family glycosylhydrolase [Oscillospiraceae bacterium]